MGKGVVAGEPHVATHQCGRVLRVVFVDHHVLDVGLGSEVGRQVDCLLQDGVGELELPPSSVTL